MCRIFRHHGSRRSSRHLASFITAIALLAAVMVAIPAPVLAKPAPATLFDAAHDAYRAGDRARALTLFTEAAEAGSLDAQWLLGKALRDGRLGVTDPQLAGQWLQRAAEEGHVGAQADLGALLLKSDETDPAVAANWLREAALRGDARARYEIGRLHEEGLGVATDLDAARRWYQQAAEQGELEAIYRLGVMNHEGLGMARNPAQAASWLRQAAERGHPDAQLRMGALRENGLGVRRDPALAASWYRRAAEQGVAWAQYRLATQLEAGNGVAADKVQAYRWMLLASRGADAQRGPWNLDAAITRLRSALAPAELEEAEAQANDFRPVQAAAAAD